MTRLRTWRHPRAVRPRTAFQPKRYHRSVREACSHEVSSAGFWPGSAAFPLAAFYSYAYPEPPGFRGRAMPPGAYFDSALGEFILPYEAVRAAADPDALLLDFLSATYEAAADCGGRDRQYLECPLGIAGRARTV